MDRAMRYLLPLGLFLLLPLSGQAAEPFLLKNGQRVLFLGDSNTAAGRFIAYLDGYLCTRFPKDRFELINLGLSSETVTGLSEAEHPFPRPNVHDRVARALEITKPDIVVLCYGMNDGIYSPFDAGRFEKYQQGILQLIEKIEKAGAKAIVMTPAPFDPKPLKDKVIPKNAEKHSYLRPYEKYDDEVLTRYSEWLVTLREKKYIVVDAHAALLKHLEAMRKTDANYRVSGDGIHPDSNGHLVIFLELLEALHGPALVHEEAGSHDAGKEFKFADFVFSSPLPLPVDPGWKKGVLVLERVAERANRFRLRYANVKGKLNLLEQHNVEQDKKTETLAVVDAADLAKGVDLSPYKELPINRRAAEVGLLIQQKRKLLDAAWLSHVGHTRPNTPKGLPLEEAKTKAAVLDESIRKLCPPANVRLRLEPAR